jgi:hypothetical protein
MSVSKFCNSGDSATAATVNAGTIIGLTLSQIANVFLRRDRANKMGGDTDLRVKIGQRCRSCWSGRCGK